MCRQSPLLFKEDQTMSQLIFSKNQHLYLVCLWKVSVIKDGMGRSVPESTGNPESSLMGIIHIIQYSMSNASSVYWCFKVTFYSLIHFLYSFVPQEMFHRGGQRGPLKILGWHTKTKSHNSISGIPLCCCSIYASWKLCQYERGKESHTDFGFLFYS